jgi:hypothetical protein
MGRMRRVSQTVFHGTFFRLRTYAKKTPSTKENTVAMAAIFRDSKIGDSIHFSFGFLEEASFDGSDSNLKSLNLF